jgi:hypothetical protein
MCQNIVYVFLTFKRDVRQRPDRAMAFRLMATPESVQDVRRRDAPGQPLALVFRDGPDVVVEALGERGHKPKLMLRAERHHREEPIQKQRVAVSSEDIIQDDDLVAF